MSALLFRRLNTSAKLLILEHAQPVFARLRLRRDVPCLPIPDFLADPVLVIDVHDGVIVIVDELGADFTAIIKRTLEITVR